MIKIFSQWSLERSNVDDMKELNQAFNDGFKTVGMMTGFGYDEDSWIDGLLILHKPDDDNPAPHPVKTSSAAATATEPTPQPGNDAPPPKTLDAFLTMVRTGDYVVLDCETTSRTNPNICQIAIIESDGNVLLDTLVNPLVDIPGMVTGIHGISNDAVKDAPTWATLQPTVREMLTGRNVVIYNAKFDRQAMHQSDRTNGLDAVDYKTEAVYWDAMLQYAEFNGEWNEYFGNYRWKKLVEAAEHFGIETTGAHNALADCIMTNKVIKAMADVPYKDTSATEPYHPSDTLADAT